MNLSSSILQVNPDCFHVDGQPVRQPRWHPPRHGDARRRPHVPLERDFDSPSESEDEDGEDEAVNQPYRVESQRAAEANMGAQAQLQERPADGLPALPISWPCGPHCCIDHCRTLAQGCSTLLEGLSSWRAATVELKQSRRGLCQVKDEDAVVEKLREVRECQLAMGTKYQPSMRTWQRAS